MGLGRWFGEAFDGVPATFPTALSADAAVAALAEQKKWRKGRSMLTGVVSADEVRLQGVQWRRDDSRFEGVVRPEGDGAVLAGRFTTPPYRKVMSGVILFLLGFIELGAFITGMHELLVHGLVPAATVPLAGGLLFGGMIGVVMLGNARPTKRAMRELTAVIHAALGPETPPRT